MSLEHIKLIEEGIMQINTFKRPNVVALDEFLKSIINTAGFVVQDSDILDGVDLEEGNLYVTYSWNSRGCLQSETHVVPLSVIYHEDPLKAAKEWGHKVILQDLLDKKRQKEKELSDIEQKIAALG